jgi:hypothetical protein
MTDPIDPGLACDGCGRVVLAGPCSCPPADPTDPGPVTDHYFVPDPDYADQCSVAVPVHESGLVVAACCGYPESAHKPTPKPDDYDPGPVSRAPADPGQEPASPLPPKGSALDHLLACVRSTDGADCIGENDPCDACCGLIEWRALHAYATWQQQRAERAEARIATLTEALLATPDEVLGFQGPHNCWTHSPSMVSDALAEHVRKVVGDGND